jgi:hypothetical protein
MVTQPVGSRVVLSFIESVSLSLDFIKIANVKLELAAAFLVNVKYMLHCLTIL